MLSRICLIATAVLSLTTATAFAGRWDVAFDGGWMRVVLDLDAQNSNVAARVYQAAPGGNLVNIDNVVVANYTENYVLQGTISSGTFQVGLGGEVFTTGDRFYLLFSKFTGEVMLILVHDASLYWATSLTSF
jgi:hypothetical protein